MSEHDAESVGRKDKEKTVNQSRKRNDKKVADDTISVRSSSPKGPRTQQWQIADWFTKARLIHGHGWTYRGLLFLEINEKTRVQNLNDQHKNRWSSGWPCWLASCPFVMTACAASLPTQLLLQFDWVASYSSSLLPLLLHVCCLVLCFFCPSFSALVHAVFVRLHPPLVLPSVLLRAA